MRRTWSRYRDPASIRSGWMLALCALMVATCAIRGLAQSPYAGTRFIIALPDTSRNFTGPYRNALPTDARIALFASEPTSATVRGPGFEKSVTIDPARSAVVWLADTAASPTKLFVDTTSAAVPYTFEITADHPVIVNCFYVTVFGSEAFTPLPVEHWGTEYYAMMLPNQFLLHVGFIQQEETFGTADAPSELIVVAATDNTTVRIDATDAVRGPRGRTVTLNAGEAYLIESDSTRVFDPVKKIDYVPPHELIGTKITADKPVGVLSGNSRTEGAPASDVATLPTGNTMRNAAIEWLAPVELHGDTFVYRPLNPIAENQTNEVIRVVATSPGTTTVTRSNGGSPVSITQGRFVEYPTLGARSGAAPEAFAITTDRPAEAMLVSGNHARLTDTTGDQAETWAPAMVELVPHERWITFGRFHATTTPRFLQHYVSIVADSGARVWLDGREVPFDPSPATGASYRHARVAISSGDHVVRSFGGSFSAISFGQIYGTEAFRPLKAPRDPGSEGIAALRPAGGAGSKTGDGAALLHKSEYFEFIAITYAAPVAGVETPEPSIDSVTITRNDGCDSTIVVIARAGTDWRSTPFEVIPPRGLTNMAVRVEDSIVGNVAVLYRLILHPNDPTQDAAGTVTVRDLAGRSWTIPYTYHARSLVASPSPVALNSIPARRTVSTVITLTNTQPFAVTITGVALAQGSQGFSILATGTLPRTIAAGGSTQATVDFFGPEWASSYADTLLVSTDCHDLRVPLTATTLDPGLRPIPEISGYDWHVRLVGSTNDTLSLVTNSGRTPYDVKQVLLLDDASGAFSLIAPDWHAIGRVAPGDTYLVGIRFRPATERVYVGRIALISTDDDTAIAELRGAGALPHAGIDPIEFDRLCLDGMLDTVLTIRNTGLLPFTIDAIDVVTTIGPSFDLTLWSASIDFPVLLLPDSALRIKLTLVPRYAGAGAYAVTIHINAGEGSVQTRVAGSIVICTHPKLVVDSLDFGTVWITLTKSGHLTLRNLGPGDAMIDGIALTSDTASAFTIAPKSTPFLLKEGDSTPIPGTFTPQTIGLKTGLVDFATEVGPLRAELRGVGAKVIDTAFVRRDYHAPPGTFVPVRIELLRPLDTIAFDSLAITLGYSRTLLDYFGLDKAGPASTTTIAREPDTLRLSLDLRGKRLTAGTTAEILFLSRVTQVDSTELPIRVETGLPYVEIVGLPGLFRLDPICGLNQRLFEWTTHLFRLEQNQPNPATGPTRIELEVPEDAPTTLIVYDLLGNERLRLIDGPLTAGTHVVTLAAGALPSGVYEYRLTQGSRQAASRMVIR